MGDLGSLRIGPTLPLRAADVDLSLVPAIDVSSSVNEEGNELQIRGYTEAFPDALVADTVAQTPTGAICRDLGPVG